MPARRPVTPKTRDQLVESSAGTDVAKERMIGELARVAQDVGQRMAKAEALTAGLAAAPAAVTGSRASGAALVSLLDALVSLGLITDGTEA